MQSVRAIRRLVSGCMTSIPTELYEAKEDAVDTTFLGRVVAFQQLDEQHVLIGENFIDSSSLTIYKLCNQKARLGHTTNMNRDELEAEAALNFGSGATCIDLQPSSDGKSFEIVVDVERFDNLERQVRLHACEFKF
jgi:hypothetical protein